MRFLSTDFKSVTSAYSVTAAEICNFCKMREFCEKNARIVRLVVLVMSFSLPYIVENTHGWGISWVTHGILSPLRLPIPPQRRSVVLNKNAQTVVSAFFGGTTRT